MEKQYFHQSLFLRNILCGTVGSLRGPLPPSPGYIHSRNIVLENNSLFQNIPRNEFPQIANVYIGETRKFKDLDRETIGAKNPSDLRCWGNRSITMSLNLLLTWSGHCRLLPLGNVMTFWIIGPREENIARGTSSPPAEQAKREDDEAQTQSHCRHRNLHCLRGGQPRCPFLKNGLRSPNVLHHTGVGVPKRGGCG